MRLEAFLFAAWQRSLKFSRVHLLRAKLHSSHLTLPPIPAFLHKPIIIGPYFLDIIIMFNSLCRSARLLRTRVTLSAVTAPSTSSLSLLLKPPRICQIAQQRSYAVFSQRDGRRTAPRPSLQDFSEHDSVAEDVEHAFTSVDGITRFQDLLDKNLIDARVVRNITEGMKYDEMTKVQQKTITSTVGGDDVLAQARTGTGKTIAFLLPVLQRIIDSPTPMRQRGVDIRAIVISPTRELAAQIYNDAAKLTRGTDIVTQLAVGGSGKNMALNKMRKEGCHMLIATPGRLNDLLENEQHLVNTEQVDTVVLDEGDTLLDQGFSEAVDKIIRYLPHAAEPSLRGGLGRQTMIFSATMPQKVLDMVRRTLRSNYKFLKMIDKGEATTNIKVKQYLVSCHGFENLLPTVYELVMKGLSPPPPPPPPPPANVTAATEETSGEPEGEAENETKESIDMVETSGENEIQKNEPFKAIVFFPTAKFASLAASTFKNLALPSDGTPHPLQRFPTFVMHSRLTQSQRTGASDRFRRCKSGILFASDVVARGMDFPNVTHVIQVCSPSSREQYIHRLGRTARGSSTSGTGYLLLTSDELRERPVQSLVRSMPLDTTAEVHSSTVQIDQEQELPKLAAEALTNITRASVTTPIEDKASAYLSLLGYFAVIFKDRQILVDALNRWSSLGWGLQTPPTVSPRLAQQMGLKGLTGLNHTPDPERRSRNFDFSSGDRRGGGFERRPQRSFDGPREGGLRGDLGLSAVRGRGDLTAVPSDRLTAPSRKVVGSSAGAGALMEAVKAGMRGGREASTPRERVVVVGTQGNQGALMDLGKMVVGSRGGPGALNLGKAVGSRGSPGALNLGKAVVDLRGNR
jgi:ATP-dependent RNA helicase MSS116